MAEFDEYKETMQAVEDQLEMAALDKEMAEEKLEQTENDHRDLREELQRVTKENDTLRGGFGALFCPVAAQIDDGRYQGCRRRWDNSSRCRQISTGTRRRSSS